MMSRGYVKWANGVWEVLHDSNWIILSPSEQRSTQSLTIAKAPVIKPGCPTGPQTAVGAAQHARAGSRRMARLKYLGVDQRTYSP